METADSAGSSSQTYDRADAATGSAAVAVRIFVVAWIYFGIAVAAGVLLRMQPVFPTPGIDFGNVLHAHSHIAFLGWVFNAFFALAVRCFVPPENARWYWRLFLATQIAVIGILVTFPVQGYARESIVFSTLHMVFAAVFVVSLLRRNRAESVSRLYLFAAGVFLLGSSLGPLTLAPIMIAGLAGTMWYELAVSYYLHFQYNGWFVFFLLAVVLQALRERGIHAIDVPARRAFPWLAAGCVLTFALSGLTLDPPLWVFIVAGAGGAAQISGCVLLVRGLRGAGQLFCSRNARIARWLGGFALGFFLLKVALQAAASWPGLVGLAANHFTIIAFMHLVFLGVVTPALIAFASEMDWLPMRLAGRIGLAILAAGAVLSQVALAYSPLAAWIGWVAWPRFFETQFAAAALMFMGVILIALDALRRTNANVQSSRIGVPDRHNVGRSARSGFRTSSRTDAP